MAYYRVTPGCRLTRRAGKWGYSRPRSRRWGDSPPIEFPTPPGDTRPFPIFGRLAAAPVGLPAKRAAHAGGTPMIRTPTTALPPSVRASRRALLRGALGQDSQRRRICIHQHCAGAFRRPFGPSRAPLSTAPAGRCADMYGFARTRRALFIPGMMRAPIKTRPDSPHLSRTGPIARPGRQRFRMPRALRGARAALPNTTPPGRGAAKQSRRPHRKPPQHSPYPAAPMRAFRRCSTMIAPGFCRPALVLDIILPSFPKFATRYIRTSSWVCNGPLCFCNV